jgi:hypothetical protein
VTPTLAGYSRDLIHSALADGPRALERQLDTARHAPSPRIAEMATSVERVAAPFGPDHFETECGVKVRGRRIVDFAAPGAKVEALGGAGDLLRVHALDMPAVSLLLRFEGAVGTVLPLLPGFIAALTFDDDELVDVAYEPSANNWRWSMYQERAAEVRALRAVAASASQHGRFRLDSQDALSVAQKMQYAKGIDPTLAVYAAYAYHDLQATERISHMVNYLGNDLGAIFFDLALLDRRLVGKTIQREDRIVPFVPLLSQGWALLKAHRFRLHPALAELEFDVRPSLWSLYDANGVRKLEQALQSREVR